MDEIRTDWESPILKVMKQALASLEESRDDVVDVLRIKRYNEQLARHDAAIVALRNAIRAYGD